jgi:hypothetical protein
MRLLVVTQEPIDAAALRAAAGEGAEDAEVLVVSPATNRSALRFWMSDADEAIRRAAETAQDSEHALSEEGVDAVGVTGEAEPAQAIEDALATFAADRIVVFGDPRGDASLCEAEGRFGVPVTFAPGP